VQEVPMVLRASESSLDARSTTVRFTLRALDDDAISITEDAKFLGPTP